MAASASSVWAVKHGPRFFAIVAASIGLIGMAGWIFDIQTFQRLHPSLVTMKFNAAVCLVSTAAALLLLREEGVKGARLYTARMLAVLVWLIGSLTFIEHVTGTDLGIDQIFFKESAEAAGKSFPGRFGITSSIVFTSLGMALLTLDMRRFRGRVPQLCVLTAALATLFVFLYYFYGIEQWEWMAKYVSIALHTVVAMLSLCAGILLARPDRGVMRVMLGDAASGVIARRLLPAATLLPVLVGWLITLGRRAGSFGPGFGSASLVVSMIVLFTSAIWATVRALRREEIRRQEKEEALRESEERFRTMADNISQFAWMTDADGYIFWYNRRWHEYTGTTLAEMQGWGWQKVQHPEHLPRVMAMWQEHLAAGEEWEDTFPCARRMGAGGGFSHAPCPCVMRKARCSAGLVRTRM